MCLLLCGVAPGSPKNPVVGLLGDDGTLFAIQGLVIAAKYQIPAVLVVLSNAGYESIRGSVRAWGKRVAPEMSAGNCARYDIGSVYFSKLASVFGISAQSITTPTDIRPAIASVPSEDAKRRTNKEVQ